MRETHTAQSSIFDFYSQHELGVHLERLSGLLDEFPQIMPMLEKDLIDDGCQEVGRRGLSVESIFRCMLLKQKLRLSYEQLSFHLSDSPTYRSFARLALNESPSKSALQANIRGIRPETLEGVFKLLAAKGYEQGEVDLSKVRMDSTVVRSNIAPPSDSQLLNDGVRVLSRYLAKSRAMTGIKIRFKDFRKASRSLSARIFYAKKAEKDVLYREMLALVDKVMGQVDRAREQVQGSVYLGRDPWLADITHYYDLTARVVDQTRRRVIDGEKVPASDKVVSLFEEHSDIIIKGQREVDYGHKLNIASDAQGLLTSVTIEQGNPADTERYLPVLDDHEALYGCYPGAVAADGGYASVDNLKAARKAGIKRVMFHKKKGLTVSAMGVKQKTYDALRDFRAGIEGNISELKRAFGMGKALWKKHDGFKAYVWSSVLCYNLTRMVRIRSG